MGRVRRRVLGAAVGGEGLTGDWGQVTTLLQRQPVRETMTMVTEKTQRAAGDRVMSLSGGVRAACLVMSRLWT